MKTAWRDVPLRYLKGVLVFYSMEYRLRLYPMNLGR